VVQGECIASAKGVGRFFLQVFIDHISLVVGWVISIAEDITRLFLARALACRVVTIAFRASWFEVANILSVPISLTVCTLCNVSCVLGRFKSDFAFLQKFHVKDILVVWGTL
jgi:hypothetical protein